MSTQTCVIKNNLDQFYLKIDMTKITVHHEVGIFGRQTSTNIQYH
jgi:hypothetical protein